MKKLVAFLVSVIATYLLAVVLVSQFNIAEITALGHSVSVSDRIQTVLHDWLGMVSLYLPMLAVAMLIAWLFTGLVLNRFISRSAVLYALAGFVAMVALHQIMHMVFEITPIAPSRNTLGLLAQALAGAVGGYLFHRLAYPADGSETLG